VVVPRRRGQQLKDVAQLDPWLRDGSGRCATGVEGKEKLGTFGKTINAFTLAR